MYQNNELMEQTLIKNIYLKMVLFLFFQIEDQKSAFEKTKTPFRIKNNIFKAFLDFFFWIKNKIKNMVLKHSTSKTSFVERIVRNL